MLIRLLLLILFFYSNISFADRFYNQVKKQLWEAVIALNDKDYELSDVEIGKLYRKDDLYEIIHLNLTKNINYVLVGACDEDCSDIDLVLANEYGDILKKDKKSNAIPVIVFTPKYSGSYKILVQIPSGQCSAYRCSYGVGLFYQTSSDKNITIYNIKTNDLEYLIQNKDDYVLIDARDSEDYSRAHIPTAISIPYTLVIEQQYKLPKDKNKTLIFYCWNEDCGYSEKAAQKARKLGYTNIYLYSQGVEGWKKAGNYFVTTEYLGDGTRI